MAGPITTFRPCPAGGSALVINQMKLTTVPMVVIDQQRFQYAVSISTLLEPFQTADSQIWIGVGLCRHSPHPGTDVGHGGSNRQMAGGDGNPKAAVVAITGNDRKGHSI